MTIADLSVILAKVQVDETDVVRLAEGDSVEVSIDAFPDTTFVGPGDQDQQQRQADRRRRPAAAVPTTGRWTSTSRSRWPTRRRTSGPT